MLTYSKIIKGFTKTIKDLEKLQDNNSSSIFYNEDRISSLTAKNSTLAKEAEMAANTSKKLKELIGDDNNA